MAPRPFWLRRIEAAWKKRPIVWLAGVRRVGKTTLARMRLGAVFLNCDLPSDVRRLEDPESFFRSLPKDAVVVLDEIHRLADPAGVLKIAADHFPDTRIVATGSSTLGASARFRDTLAGRKEEVWLTPMVLADLDDFENRDLSHRLLRGGVPPFFLAEALPERDFQEWVDAYWAKDVLELFRLERRHSFQRLLELLMAQSGGLFEATPFARACEVSRTTITNYVSVLEATFVVHVIRPFAAGGAAEIVAAPRIYGFDTGFVCYHRGWHSLRRDDLGVLWEHFVLNELHAHLGREPIHYWRSKHGNEVDFVLVRRGAPPVAVECKWSAAEFDVANVRAFRTRYPDGLNLVVARDVDRPYTRRYGDLAIRFTSLSELVATVTRPSRPGPGPARSANRRR